MKRKITTTETVAYEFEVEMPDGLEDDEVHEWVEDFFVNNGPKPEWFLQCDNRAHSWSSS